MKIQPELIRTLRRRRLQHQLQRAVNSLPDDSGSIAALLELHGIHGVRKHHRRCPLANYFEERLKVPFITVTPTRVAVSNFNLFAAVRLPKAAEQFVDRFDSGYYPELTEPEQGVRSDRHE